MVFHSYLDAAHDSNWWREKISAATVSKTDAVQEAARNVLSSVIDYHDASGKKPVNYQGYADMAANLEKSLSECEGRDVAPILKIVALDYLGLANRQRSFDSELSGPDKEAVLAKSADALTQCFELAKKHDDPALPLWQGYSKFSLARVTEQQGNKDQGYEMLKEARGIREQWLAYSDPSSPVIKEAFKLEYLFSAVAVAEARKEPSEVQLAREEHERLKLPAGSKGSQLPLARTVAEKVDRLPKAFPGMDDDQGQERGVAPELANAKK